ncbi:MAG: GGDEF domain-containing protein [Actinomycetia bacterium]|nr:GGDEF domain-containing protein [Actinomycetes bacterium]
MPDQASLRDLACLAGRAGPDMAVVIDPGWKIRFASSASERILALKPSPHRQYHLLQFVHPADARSIMPALDALAARGGYHGPITVRLRATDDKWVACEITTEAVDGPGGAWMVLAVREVAERDELADRQATLQQLIHFASVEFAKAHWYDVGDVTQHLLQSLCGLFGASVVEIAWSEHDAGPLRIEASWAARSRDDWTPGQIAQIGATFDEVCLDACGRSTGACMCSDLSAAAGHVGAKHCIDAGLDATVEMRLSAERPRAVLRLGFEGGLGSWDEINTEPVSLLGLLVLSSMRRCRAEAALHERARRDSLTGVLNRDEFYRLLGVCVGSPQQVGRVGVLYCDVDRFKTINDRFGHAAGDEVLRAVAEALSQSVREGDEVARVGGDEFVALCRGLESPEQIDAVAGRVSARMEALSVGGEGVGLSIGTTVFRAGQGVDALVGAADAEMYKAKRRNAGASGSSGQVGDGVVEHGEQGGT